MTHILFTMGPSTDNDEILKKAFINGANGCRLTFSYGTCEIQATRARRLKRLAEEVGRKCFIVADLAGEKIRLKNFDSPSVNIKLGERITLCPPEEDSDINEKRFSINSSHFFEQVKVNDKVIIGDGSLILKIEQLKNERTISTAITDGMINPNRGIIVQGNNFNPESLTPKDLEDLKFIAGSGCFDAVAISFVSGGSDIEQARNIFNNSNRNLPIIAKIETMKGLENIEEITGSADCIMAARGDLALAIPWTDLFMAVSKIQKMAEIKNKPWILATQLVEGIERFAFPTRAEICDLTNWLTKGAAGVMLSYETAFGGKPVEAILSVAQIVEKWGTKSHNSFL